MQWETHFCYIHPRSNNNAPGRTILGGRFESWSADAGSGTAALLAAPGFEPPTKKYAAAYITVRPLLILRPAILPTAWTRVCR